MNETPQSRRIVFLLLATLLPGLAAGIGAGALARRADRTPRRWARGVRGLRSSRWPARARRRAPCRRIRGGRRRASARAGRGAGRRAAARCRRSPRPSTGWTRGCGSPTPTAWCSATTRRSGACSAPTRSWSASGRCSWCGATELHDAVLRACREGVTSKVEVSMDAPRSKTLEVHVAPAGRLAAGKRGRVPRRHRAQAAGAGAPGLRRQREPRAADAHHRHPGLRRDAALRRAVRRQARPADGGDHPPAVGAARRAGRRTCSSCPAWSRRAAALARRRCRSAEVARQASEAMEPSAAGKRLVAPAPDPGRPDAPGPTRRRWSRCC